MFECTNNNIAMPVVTAWYASHCPLVELRLACSITLHFNFIYMKMKLHLRGEITCVHRLDCVYNFENHLLEVQRRCLDNKHLSTDVFCRSVRRIFIRLYLITTNVVYYTRTWRQYRANLLALKKGISLNRLRFLF